MKIERGRRRESERERGKGSDVSLNKATRSGNEHVMLTEMR